jgi:hypothetical protein
MKTIFNKMVNSVATYALFGVLAFMPAAIAMEQLETMSGASTGAGTPIPSSPLSPVIETPPLGDELSKDLTVVRLPNSSLVAHYSTSKTSSTTELFDTTTQKVIKSLKGRFPVVSPDSKYLVTRTMQNDGKQWLYYAQTGAPLLPVNEEDKVVMELAGQSITPVFSPDGQWYATAKDKEDATTLINLETTRLRVIPGRSPQFSKDSRYVFTVIGYQNSYRYDLGTLQGGFYTAPSTSTTRPSWFGWLGNFWQSKQ